MGGCLRFVAVVGSLALAACAGGPGVDPPTDRADGAAPRDAGDVRDAAGPLDLGHASDAGPFTDAGTSSGADGGEWMGDPDAAPVDAASAPDGGTDASTAADAATDAAEDAGAAGDAAAGDDADTDGGGGSPP